MNIFTQYLSLLKVKHTNSFSERYYGQHPYKYTLYGISKMLSDYKVHNVGLKINSKEELSKLEAPFVAQVSDDFVLVTKVSEDFVGYIWQEKKIEIFTDKFKEIWSGVVVLAEPDEHSIEPDYSKHILRDRFVLLEKLAVAALLLMAAGYSLFSGRFSELWARLGLVAIGGVGMYVSYLLLLKQMKIGSRSADKICSLFKKGDCNDVLEMLAAKIMGIIGWSEVGFGYFLSNVLIAVFFPNLLPYAAWINVAALPYTLWSVWYQKFRAKQWCTLCLMVQILLWLTFVAYGSTGLWQLPAFAATELVTAAILFMVPLFLINLLVPKLTDAQRVSELKQEFGSMRLKDEIFLTYLRLQPRYKVDRTTSCVLFGNPDAKILVTVLTNPHCNPCARMHQRIEALIKETNNTICVQYIFSAFEDELESSGKFLTAVYMNHNNEMDFVASCFDKWFANGSTNREAFFAAYNEKVDCARVSTQYAKHIAWRQETKLVATPTILVNGYVLPSNYKIEDLKYFVDLDIV